MKCSRKQKVESAQQQANDEIECLAQWSLAEQWEAKKGTLQIMLKKHLSSDDWTKLEELACSGQISALTRSLSAASAQSGAVGLRKGVENLKLRLNGELLL